MKIRFFISTILCFTLVLGSCSPGKDEQDKAEPKDTATETTETAKTHVGGCILATPSAEVPEDLYQETDIVPTEEYKPFTKKLMVYGITLIGRDDISDDFMRKVAKTITLGMVCSKSSYDRGSFSIISDGFLIPVHSASGP
jgi:hypothetical protein